jgi:predicted HD superfamily hydrolase involved in NAD metabolism
VKNIEKQIFNYLSKHLTHKRFEHSCNVATLARELASKHNVDALKAQIAGLLHDCAKCMSNDEFVGLFNGRRKTFKHFSKIVKFSPNLLHSFAGEIVAKEKFKINDKDILNAIKNHTQGRSKMSVLEKIVFVADFVSNDRKMRYVKKLQNLAKQNLDKAFFEVLTKKIEHVISEGIILLPQTVDTWNWYVSNNKKNK